MDTLSISAETIEQAARDLAPYLRTTPLQYSRAFTSKTRGAVYLKLESVQPIRAFKVRGALNKLIRMTPAERALGVITASAGNHGMGVAHAALTFGVAATVYVPANANQLKIEAIRRLGARVVEHGRSYRDAELEARRNQGSQTFLHAYEDADVIAGQGTLAVELLDDLPGTESRLASPPGGEVAGQRPKGPPGFDTVIVPIGGGGLIAGVAGYLKQRLPAVKVVGVEPFGAAAMKASLDAGRPVTLERVQTMADGLAASRPGDICFEIAKRTIDQMVLVEEAEMLRAIKLYFEWEHLLAEPAGAAALAALLYRYSPSPGERVVVILSGANVTDEVMLRALKSR